MRWLLTISLVFALTALGCGDEEEADDANVAGGLAQACYPNETCNAGLICYSGLCVPENPTEDAGGETDASASSDAAADTEVGEEAGPTDTVDEDTVDEDTVDEDAVDEDAVDEDAVDEDAVDKDVAAGDTTGEVMTPLEACGSMSFVGPAPHVEVGHDDALGSELTEFPDGVTMEAWVRLNSLSDCQIIARKHEGDNAGYSFGLRMVTEGDAEITFFSEGNPGGGAASAGVVEKGKWTHVAATLDGEAVRLWHNGVLVHEESHILPDPTNDDLYIGGFPPGNKCYLDGSMSQFRITGSVVYTDDFEPEWALTSDDSTRGFWPFNDSATEDFEPSVARDVSGNGFHGAVAEVEWVDGECPGVD